MPTPRSTPHHVVVLSKPNQLNWLVVLVLTGAMAWLEFYYGAVLLLLFWTVASTGKTLLEIDDKAHAYRMGLRLFGAPLTNWHPLPKAQRVVVRYFSEYTITNNDGGDEEAHKSADYIVLLSVPNSSRGYILLRHPHYKEAVRIACEVGSILRLEVIECNRYQQTSTIQEAELAETEA